MFDEAQTPTYDVHPELQQATAPLDQPQVEQPSIAEVATQTTLSTEQEAMQVGQTAAQFAYNEVETNLKKMRADKARVERERDELARMLREAQNPYNPHGIPAQPNNTTSQPNMMLGDEDIVEGKHFKQLQQQTYNQQQEFLRMQQQQTAALREAKLRIEMPDLDKVLSEENVLELKDRYPEIAQSLANTDDIYTKGKSAYQLMKSLGIYKEDNYVVDRAKAQANAAKPRPLTSVSPQQGDSPLSHANAFANGLTDDLKKQLHKEMMAAIKTGR